MLTISLGSLSIPYVVNSKSGPGSSCVFTCPTFACCLIMGAVNRKTFVNHWPMTLCFLRAPSTPVQLCSVIVFD